MEQRITAAVTASISTLIADKLRPIEENIRNLTVTKQTINTHSTAINKLMKENQTLQKKITESKEENRELRTRLNKLEDKLMDNNVVIMGVAEEGMGTGNKPTGKGIPTNSLHSECPRY